MKHNIKILIDIKYYIIRIHLLVHIWQKINKYCIPLISHLSFCSSVSTHANRSPSNKIEGEWNVTLQFVCLKQDDAHEIFKDLLSKVKHFGVGMHATKQGYEFPFSNTSSAKFGEYLLEWQVKFLEIPCSIIISLNVAKILVVLPRNAKYHEKYQVNIL